jgi:isocitrate dehydrogenase kinase/phosphatase
MLTMIGYWQPGRESCLARLTWRDYRPQSSVSTVLVRTSTRMEFGMTVEELARDVVRELYRQMEHKLTQCDGQLTLLP